MNRFLVSSFLFLLLISINSCTIQLTCELYNNTSHDLKVIQLNNGSGKSEQEFKANSVIKLEGWQLFAYKIVSKNTAWGYDQIAPSHDLIAFVGFGPWTKRIFQAQLEKNGSIFVLQSDQSLPTSEFSDQPKGFPLIPIGAN